MEADQVAVDGDIVTAPAWPAPFINQYSSTSLPLVSFQPLTVDARKNGWLSASPRLVSGYKPIPGSGSFEDAGPFQVVAMKEETQANFMHHR